MRKQVLVIGGSYFVGRVFSILCSRGEEFELHVVNRGRAPLRMENVHEYVSDRHEISRIESVLPKDLTFDAVVDLCGYERNEIAPIIERLHDRIGQYIFISTASVYENEDHTIKTEDDPIVSGAGDDPIMAYRTNKAALERELRDSCQRHSLPYTIVRPSFIYGPFNYAPRESWYIKKIAHGEPIDVLADGTAHFNFAFVGDVAEALMRFIGDERAYNQVFNVANPEVITEKLFVDTLDELHGTPLEKIVHTVQDVVVNQIPIPWPLVDDELYDGTKLQKTLDFTYTPFSNGMARTYRAFMKVYEPHD